MIKNLTTIKLFADDIAVNGKRLADWSPLEDLIHFEALVGHLHRELVKAVRERTELHGRRR